MTNLDDKISLNDAAQTLGNAFAKGDENEIKQAFISYSQALRTEIMNEANGAYAQGDRAVMIARGSHELTNEETKYYQKVISCMQSEDPKQELANANIKMPETVIDRVFDDLKKEHPLLNEIDFINTNADIKILVNRHNNQLAVWSKLNAEIVKEIESDFAIIDTGLYKLSAFLPVAKDMLELGPKWIDRYVRVILTEALSLGLEDAIINGDGKDRPIGMTRQVGDDVTVTGGVYPLKTKIAISDLTPKTYGGLIAQLTDSGKRDVKNVVLLVNPVDYYSKVMPATTVLTPSGQYANNVFPYPTKVIQSTQVTSGEIVLGCGKRYFMSAGLSKGGKIEQSDHAHFLEDERLYLIKCHANGMPLNACDFLRIDISALEALSFTVNANGLVTPVADGAAS